MRRPTPLKMSESDREELLKLVARPKAPAGHVRRARVVLMSDEGVPGVEIAERLGLAVEQVSRIRARYLRGGLAGLADQPRRGRGNNVSLDLVVKVLAAVMTPPPPGYSHWSTRQLGEKFGLGRTVVSKILRANNLKPHRTATFKVSRDPEFDAKVLDVVGLYLNPPTKAVVVSLDEKTQIQALERTQPMLPLRPGQVARHTHDYERHGVLDLYAAMNLGDGEIVHRVTKSHTGKDFLGFLKLLAKRYPNEELHVVLDNSSTHRTPDVKDWLAKNPRVVFHFTPTSASWLNLVEGVFSILTRRSVRRASFASRTELRKHLRAFFEAWNRNSKPFVWSKSARSIIRDHRRILARISGTEH